MFRQLENGDWVEYQIIPEREQVTKRMTSEEFKEYETIMKAQLAEDALKIGQKIIADKQKIVDEINLAKATAEEEK